MKRVLQILIALTFPLNIYSQDLQSSGDNSWLFHTPDNGGRNLYIIPGQNGSNWNFGAQIEISNLGNINIPLHRSIGFLNLSDVFQYEGKAVGNYSLGWYNDSWSSGAPSSYYSGYGGIKFFTQGAPRMAIDYGGNIGIGTTAPQAKFEVGSFLGNGDLGTILGRLPEGHSSGTGTFLGVRGYKTQPTDVKSFALEHSFFGQVNNSINFHRGGSVTGGFISFNTDNNSEKLRITSNGNVGIGTTNPSQKLTVKGTVYSTEVKVDVNAGTVPDYVFEPTYNLPTLAETEAYIKANKHLPEVPSAKEMEANGINLSEMNMLLLKKVEELTLHVIELSNLAVRQQKKLEEQGKQLAEQGKQVEELLTKK